ncbi:MAG TPA: hypothetical protein ENG20_00135 [Methanomicrobia archaeon]|nr:hypothetical protein [Methanomicrobia archaeon]
MENKILTDIIVLSFFILLIVLRRYLFTERFLKFLKKNWPVFGFPVAIILLAFIPEEPSPYQELIVVVCMFFIGYFFLYGYFVVNIESLRNRKGLRKKWQIAVLPFISILTFDQAYDYFTTEQYSILDILVFMFFLGFVIYVSHFLFKETFFRKGG